MWFPSFLLVGALALSGCGMRPLYAPSAPWKDAYPVHVATISDREGQLLRKSLLRLFSPYGPSNQVLYELKTSLHIEKDEIGLRQDQTAQRNRITAKASYALVDRATKKNLLEGTRTSINSYAIGDNSATSMLPLIVAEKDAKARSMEELAFAIHTDVILYLQEHPIAQESGDMASTPKP